MSHSFIKSSITGGHYGFVAQRSNKVFTNKMREALLIPLLPTDVVVDIGGYVGEYSMCASKVASVVHTYEPTPATFEVLSSK